MWKQFVYTVRNTGDLTVLLVGDLTKIYRAPGRDTLFYLDNSLNKDLTKTYISRTPFLEGNLNAFTEEFFFIYALV